MNQRHALLNKASPEPRRSRILYTDEVFTGTRNDTSPACSGRVTATILPFRRIDAHETSVFTNETSELQLLLDI